jgi:hypothetical protein
MVFRVQELARRQAGRWARRDWRMPGAHATPLPSLPGLREGLASLPLPPELLADWRSWARRVEEGRVAVFGVDVPRRAGRWHLDPVSGRSWPADAYCFDIDHRHAAGYGDIKLVWELNRLQHLQPVAALAAATGNRGLARLCAAEIEDWIDANPPFLGVNWKSGIELGLRTVSLIVVSTLAGDEAFSPAQREKLWASLAAHGAWLARFPSRFSSANNHRIAEALGLFVLGAAAPGRSGWRDRAERARTVLQEETLLQIHADGVGAEQSPTYTAFTLEMLLLCAVLDERAGRPWLPACRERMARAGEFLRWLTDDGGQQPRIGDDDEGCVFHPGGPAHASSVLACLAAYCRRPDLMPPRHAPQLRQAFLGAIDAAPRPLSGVRCFAEGGYTVVRDSRSAMLLVFDHGPLGYLSIAAHGHADALAVWLHIGDRPVLVDAGTYLYASEHDERRYFRGTAAHNTLSVAGTDSSEMTGPFNWGARARARLVALDDSPDGWFVEGEHDGFLRRYGVRHHRRIARLDADGVAIEDWLDGAAEPLPVEIGFLVAPDLELRPLPRGWTISDGGQILLAIDHGGPLQAEIERGLPEPLRGWVSERFGSMRPCARLAVRGVLRSGMRSVIRLRRPGQAGDQRRAATAS